MSDLITKIANMIGEGGQLAPHSAAGELLNECANALPLCRSISVKPNEPKTVIFYSANLSLGGNGFEIEFYRDERADPPGNV